MDECPFCGADTRPGDNYCLKCGQGLLPQPRPPGVRESPRQPARLVLRTASGGKLQEYLLDKAEIAIGRAPESNILLANDGLASLMHAVVRYENDQYYLHDNRSANGTFVNGNLIDERVPLHNGDQIGIGEHELIFYYTYNSPTRQQTTLGNRPEHPAHLVLYAESGETLQEYLLEKAEITIGRAPTSDILLSKDHLASRLHATIHYANHQYYLCDEYSANGTFVNGNQLTAQLPYLLHNEDHVGIGEHELVFYAYTFPIERPARLVLHSKNSETFQEYPLDKAEIIIGRAPTSDILLPGSTLISHRHAVIRYRNNQYLFYEEEHEYDELNTRCPTYMNNEGIEMKVPYLLHDGDKISIGGYELVFYTYNFLVKEPISFNETPFSHHTHQIGRAHV